jgi:hypothetical protein
VASVAGRFGQEGCGFRTVAREMVCGAVVWVG